MKRLKVYTVLFTENCPLNCRYCYLRSSDRPDDLERSTLSLAQVRNLIQNFDKSLNSEEEIGQILFTGGEPFLYFNEIVKPIMNEYGDHFQWQFNTSGYCFTEEILEYLSKFMVVSFVLSTDGPRAVTNYLRPFKSGNVGYWDKLKEISPTLLYYFPKTPYRSIVNPRWCDQLYNCYLDADRLGFKYFSFILDFRSRPNDLKENQKPWTQENIDLLSNQIQLISKEFLLGFLNDIKKPQINEIDNIISFLFKQIEFKPENLPCQVFNNRGITSVYDKNLVSKNCLSECFNSLDEAKKALEDAYIKQNHKCKLDPNCPAFEYCALTTCPKDSYYYYKEFFKVGELECILNKVCYEAAIKILSAGNQNLLNNTLYKQYLGSMGGGV